MGIVRDVTVDQLTQAVGNIDTSRLAQDSTLQDVVTALQNLHINVNQEASNVSYDNTTSGASATNVQGAIDLLFSSLFSSIGSEIASGSLNNITNPGVYYFTASSAITDAPFTNNSGCNMYVLPRSGITSRVFQIVISYLSTGCNISIRSMSGATTWTAWRIL